MPTFARLARAALTGAVLAAFLALGMLLPKCEGSGPHPYTQAASVTAARPAVTCHIVGNFTWERPGRPGYPYGLSRFRVTYNNCRDRVRAFISCVYIGPHAAEITRIDTGNVVISGVTQVKCAPSFRSGPYIWQFNHSRGAGFEYYGSGGPGWHLRWLVS